MRALRYLLVAVVLSTGCSSDSTQVDGSPATGQVDEETSDGARQVGEPSNDGSTAVDSLDADALAFDRPAAAPRVDPTNDQATNEDSPSSPGDGDLPEPPDEESTELSRLLDELIVFVEQERGHTFTQRPVVTLLDGTAFTAEWNALVTADAAENADEYVNYTDIYRAMGIIDGSVSLEEIWKLFGDAGVLGYYDPDRGDIVLRSGEITAFTKTVLVHELVHALDDQVFGIDRDAYDERDDEIDWTFSSLIEGSAGVIEERYRATLSTAERDEEVAVQRALPRGVSLSEFTDSFLELQFGRYRYGDAFAAALWERGRDDFDRAFEDPPGTSEVIIDPAAFLAGSPTDGAIEAPPAGGEVFESGLWGEAAWAALFADGFGTSEGRQLADGWGGDHFVAWRDGATTCVRLHVEADSPEALDNYALALEEWSLQALGREVFYPTADLVRVTGCA